MPSKFRPHRREGAERRPPGAHELSSGHVATATVIAFSADAFWEGEVETIEELAAVRERFDVLWVDVVGHGDEEILLGVRDAIGLHPLAVEDVVNLGQRPKVEEYDENLFCVVRMPSRDERDRVQTEQLSLFLAEGVVVTFQERDGDCLDEVRERIRTARGRVRTRGADYLFYTIIDAVVDAYLPLLEALGDAIEDVEEAVLLEKHSDPVSALHAAGRNLLVLRKAVLPLRFGLERLVARDHRFIAEDTTLYFRDCIDHLHRAADLIDSYRDLSRSVIDAHISVESHRMNDIMGLLTVVSTIFIPLSFLVGLWGMNFDYDASRWNMPELHLPYAYPVALLFMFAAAAGQLWFFYKKGWLRFRR